MKKLVLTLSFVSLVILLMGGSCGLGPQGNIGNISDTSLSLTAQAGATATASFTFENTGTATLNYTASENENFLKITQGATGTVAPGSTATVTLEAACQTVGTFNGTVSISGNGGKAEVKVEVTCTTPTAQLDNLSDTSLPLSARVGSSSQASFTFDNTGRANLTYTASTSANFLEIPEGGSGTVTPKNTATVTVQANCTAEGTFNGTVTIVSNGGNASVAVALTCTAQSPTGYTIDLRFIGTTTTAAQKAAFEQAALRWEAVIQSDLTDEALNTDAITFLRGPNGCDPSVPNIAGETIDDIVIFAKVGPIDGANGILAQAGPNLLHSTQDLPLVGCMVFDSADIDSLVGNGSFTDVVTHEMGHVLGIGTLWEGLGLLDYAPASSQGCSAVATFTKNPGFIGQNARNNALGAVYSDSKFVPVEDEFGKGTKCGHWDEGIFDNELMTGFAEAPGVTMPLSKLTIGSLQDVGYDVDYASFDNYKLPSCLPNCTALKEPGGTDELLLKEKLLYPKFAVDAQGNIKPINDR